MSTYYKISEDTAAKVVSALENHLSDGEYNNDDVVDALNALQWELKHPENRLE